MVEGTQQTTVRRSNTLKAMDPDVHIYVELPHWTEQQPQAEFCCEHLQVPGIETIHYEDVSAGT